MWEDFQVNIHGKTGCMVNVGDTSRLSQHVLDTLKDEESLNQLKRNARLHAQNFSKEVVIPRYIDVYSSLIQ